MFNIPRVNNTRTYDEIAEAFLTARVISLEHNFSYLDAPCREFTKMHSHNGVYERFINKESDLEEVCPSGAGGSSVWYLFRDKNELLWIVSYSWRDIDFMKKGIYSDNIEFSCFEFRQYTKSSLDNLFI